MHSRARMAVQQYATRIEAKHSSLGGLDLIDITLLYYSLAITEHHNAFEISGQMYRMNTPRGMCAFQSTRWMVRWHMTQGH